MVFKLLTSFRFRRIYTTQHVGLNLTGPPKLSGPGKRLPFPEGGAASAGWHLSAHTLPGTAAGARPWRRPAALHTSLPTGSAAQPAPETAAKRGHI